jgi:hypothetical protein
LSINGIAVVQAGGDLEMIAVTGSTLCGERKHQPDARLMATPAR